MKTVLIASLLWVLMLACCEAGSKPLPPKQNTATQYWPPRYPVPPYPPGWKAGGYERWFYTPPNRMGRVLGAHQY
jgi:hypothetical protein